MEQTLDVFAARRTCVSAGLLDDLLQVIYCRGVRVTLWTVFLLIVVISILDRSESELPCTFVFHGEQYQQYTYTKKLPA